MAATTAATRTTTRASATTAHPQSRRPRRRCACAHPRSVVVPRPFSPAPTLGFGAAVVGAARRYSGCGGWGGGGDRAAGRQAVGRRRCGGRAVHYFGFAVGVGVFACETGICPMPMYKIVRKWGKGSILRVQNTQTGSRLRILVRSEFCGDSKSALKRLPARVVGCANIRIFGPKGARLSPFSGPPPLPLSRLVLAPKCV